MPGSSVATVAIRSVPNIATATRWKITDSANIGQLVGLIGPCGIDRRVRHAQFVTDRRGITVRRLYSMAVRNGGGRLWRSLIAGGQRDQMPLLTGMGHE
jgi:hypothetical protein